MGRKPTPSARFDAAIADARRAAVALGMPSVSVELLWIGALLQRSSTMERVWATGLDPVDLLAELQRERPAHLGGPAVNRLDSTDLPLEPEASSAIRHSIAIAGVFGPNIVQPEHLLLALLGDPDGQPPEFLSARGVDANLVRTLLSAEMQPGPIPEVSEVRRLACELIRNNTQAGIAFRMLGLDALMESLGPSDESPESGP